VFINTRYTTSGWVLGSTAISANGEYTVPLIAWYKLIAIV